MLFDRETLFLYIAAATALVAAPGPGQALVTARTLAHGVRAGFVTSLGLNVGTLTHAIAAALGLSAIFASSELAFTLVKFAGAAYLIVLGVRGLMANPTPTASTEADPDGPSTRALFVHAAMTGILNPKVALFFIAFLPQFVDPKRGLVFLQFFTLGAILATIGVIGDSIVALLAAALRERVRSSSTFTAWRERLMGAVLIALGLRLALAARR